MKNKMKKYTIKLKTYDLYDLMMNEDNMIVWIWDEHKEDELTRDYYFGLNHAMKTAFYEGVINDQEYVEFINTITGMIELSEDGKFFIERYEDDTFEMIPIDHNGYDIIQKVFDHYDDEQRFKELGLVIKGGKIWMPNNKK